MEPGGSGGEKPSQAAGGRVRARSLPTRRHFNLAAFFFALHVLGLISMLTAMVVVFLDPSQLGARLFIGGLSFSVVTWGIALFKRRSAICPLCKGTPLMNSGARPHAKAVRLFPLNHGVTATLSVIAMQRFRCMYCGSDFDLLKTPSHRRGSAGDDYLD